MRLKKLKDSQGRECYGISCEDIERHGKAFDGDDLQKSAPAASRGLGLKIRKSDGSTEVLKLAPATSTEGESLADLRRSINRQFDELTESVKKLVKERMTADARFHPQNPNEPATRVFVEGMPARKALGDNPA